MCDLRSLVCRLGAMLRRRRLLRGLDGRRDRRDGMCGSCTRSALACDKVRVRPLSCTINGVICPPSTIARRYSARSPPAGGRATRAPGEPPVPASPVQGLPATPAPCARAGPLRARRRQRRDLWRMRGHSVPATASASRVTMRNRETLAMLGTASPRNPKVRISARSPELRSLLVACRSNESRASSRDMPQPSSPHQN
mgnify:CR=1 FL=1